MFLGKEHVKEAVVFGQLEDVKYHFERAGKDEKSKWLNDEKLLLCAAKHDQPDIAKFLLKNNIPVDEKDPETGATALHLASMNGSCRLVRILIEFVAENEEKNGKRWKSVIRLHSDVAVSYQKKAFLETKLAKSSTSLHLATISGHSEIVNLLLQNSADIEAKSNYDYTALHWAASEGNVEIVKILLDNRANVEAKAVLTCTPLHLAAANGHHEVVRTLLKYAADPEPKAIFSFTPLHLAIECGHQEVVKVLTGDPAASDTDNDKILTPPLGVPGTSGSDSDVLASFKKSMLLKLGYFKTFILSSDSAGNSGCLTQLLDATTQMHDFVESLKANEDPNLAASKLITVITPVHKAGKILLQSFAASGAPESNAEAQMREKLAGCCKVLEAFLEGLTFTEAGKFASVHSQMVQACVEMLEALQKYSAENVPQNNYDFSPLHLAAGFGQVGILKVLLERKADVNAKNDNKYTPLHLAAQFGHVEAVKTLLGYSADIEAKCDSNYTSLHYAAGSNHVEVVKILLRNSANIQAKAHNNFTPLHLAAHFGRAEIVKTLLQSSADVEAKCTNNQTPLQAAAAQGHQEVFKLLLSGNAKVERSSIDAAKRSGHLQIAQCLQQRYDQQKPRRTSPLLQGARAKMAQLFGGIFRPTN